MFMPGARVVSTVVASEPTAASQTEQQHDVADEEQPDEPGVAAAGPAVGGDRDHDQHAADEPRPEPGGGQAREGQRTSAELQRHDGDGDSEQQRHQHDEREADAIQREELRDRVDVEHRRLGVDALDAEQRSDHDRAEQGDERDGDEQPPDALVVGGGQPVGHRRQAGTRRRCGACCVRIDGGHWQRTLFVSGARAAPDSVLDRLRTIGVTPARLPIGRRAGGNPQMPERTRMSMVIAANNNVT